MPSSTLAPSAHPSPRFRSKTLASLLAALAGWTGIHHRYLGRRHGWILLLASLVLIGLMLRADTWYRHPAFFVWVALATAGFLEGVILALLSDERFDARYNPGQSRRNRTGWAPVIIAILTLALGALVFMFGLALLVETLYERFFA